MHFELVLGWILVFVVMESQDPNDWQLPLSQLPVDPDQPSTSRRRAQDEAEPSERCVQPRTEPCVPQFSLPVLQLENKALVIVLESESTLSRCGSTNKQIRGSKVLEQEKCVLGVNFFWLSRGIFA